MYTKVNMYSNVNTGIKGTNNILRYVRNQPFIPCPEGGFWWHPCVGNPTQPNKFKWGDQKVVYMKILIRRDDDNPPVPTENTLNSCSEVAARGNINGIYLIDHGDNQEPSWLYCDGGNTFVMIRSNGSENVINTAADYMKVFYKPGWYWTGLDNIKTITKLSNFNLVIKYVIKGQLETYGERWEKYFNFKVDGSNQISYDDFTDFQNPRSRMDRGLEVGDTFQECKTGTAELLMVGMWWRCTSKTQDRWVAPTTNVTYKYFNYELEFLHVYLVPV